ncbi:MAG: hypothetical protein K8J31_27135 [Anaerolineae bacterium]|nr:hypothetical protein [Anaerolineae bacterium]
MKTLVVIPLILGALLLPALAQETPAASWTDSLREVVDQVPGIRQVVDVVIEDEDVRITYVTAEADEVGYRAEMLDVFWAVGRALNAADRAVNHVILVSAVAPDDFLEEITIDSVHLAAYAEEKLTRTELLDLLSIEPLEHLNPDASSNADV